MNFSYLILLATLVMSSLTANAQRSDMIEKNTIAGVQGMGRLCF